MARESRVAQAASAADANTVDATIAEQSVELVENSVAFDERSLADASISGSTKAFEELYAHYYPKVRGFCLRKTSNPALAEDIAQEAFARAFERIEEFGGPKHFGGWVGTIAANLITDHYRRKRNTEVSLDAKFEDPDRGPSYDVDPIRNIQRSDTSRLVQLALAKLDDRQREALLLHEVKGMTCAAVGSQLGISEVAAESLLARARRRLRKEITAKATPADLFGLGGLGLLPALWRAWKRTREAASRRAGAFQAAAGRTFEGLGVNGLTSFEGARALVVVVGAALAVEAAGAAAPVMPATTIGSAAASAPAASSPSRDLLPPDGDTSGLRPANDLPADFGASLDTETGAARVATNGSSRIPAPESPADMGPLGPVGPFGPDWELVAGGEGTQWGVDGRVVVREENGDAAFDSGRIDKDVEIPTP